MKNSHIEWTDHTWNPLLGCDKCSDGCKFCYAIRTAWRLQHNPNPGSAAAYVGLVEQRPDGSLNWTGKINLLPERLQEPIRWKKPARIFVNSQSDLFHPNVPDAFIDQVFAVMAACPQHTFQVLTKRPERMRDYLNWDEREAIIETAGEKLAAKNGWCHAHGGVAWPLPNVWLGVSVENQRAADERREFLKSTLAAVRFVSYEPALGPVNWTGWEWLGWLISGGESGPGARPSHPDWHRWTRDFCQEFGIAYLFKQWGEHLPLWQGVTCGQISALPDVGGFNDVPVYRVGKKASGRLLDGVEHNGFPQTLQAAL